MPDDKEHIQGGIPKPFEERIRPELPTARAVSTAAAESKPRTEPKDNAREIIETIVFVAVLVLLLKTFVAEAFVIPTGSMATTLLGYHRKVTCEQCGYHFLLNASSEGDPQHGQDPRPVVGGYCPNCRYYNELHSPGPQDADRQREAQFNDQGPQP